MMVFRFAIYPATEDRNTNGEMSELAEGARLEIVCAV